jgi:flagellar motility protein MotE (MotC chaperone)
MAMARKQKLKVFRTPIGFHDAYVAAPSQKAALEAWGADSNIFAQGIAEQVTDPKLMEEALANPGKVIKKVRGSADEHFAELDRAPARKKATKASEEVVKVDKIKSRAKPKPKPSRDDLDAAEEALEKADKKQRKELRKIDDKMQALEREKRELQRRHEADRDKLTAKRDRARSAYDRAMRKWRGS